MGKFTGVLLASDYDDTLYDHACTISPQNRAAVEYFIAQGGLFCISTGRSYINFAIQMEQENLPVNTPVILSNGASIHDFSRGKTLWSRDLPPTAQDVLTEVCRAFPEVGFESYHANEVYTYRANIITQKHLTRCRLSGLPREIDQMPGPWIKVILQHPEPAYLEAVQAYLQEHWPEEYDVTFSNPYLLELTARGANKGACVLWVADHMGVAREHIYCIGNGLNDIPMLQVAALSFAPGDSYPPARKAADVVLSTCDESCIAEMIARLDERYSRA